MATEAEAVAKLARETVTAPTGLPDDGAVVAVALPPEWEHHEIDTQRWAPHPRRPAGTVQVHDGSGFVLAVQQRAAEVDPVLYADEERMALVGVLNDDHAVLAGWRDHRIELVLRRRPEWTHWTKLDGQMVDQEVFASHIEDGLAEITEPAAADMLDLAQTFHATTSARFKSGNRLNTGARQLVYEEDIDASAGAAGTLAIPEWISLNVQPFFGSSKWVVRARFRFDLRGGNLRLGYKLDRPHDVERAAFGEVREHVAEELKLVPIAGVAPSARS